MTSFFTTTFGQLRQKGNVHLTNWCHIIWTGTMMILFSIKQISQIVLFNWQWNIFVSLNTSTISLLLIYVVLLDYHRLETHNEANVNLSLWFAHQPHAFLVVADDTQNSDIIFPTAIQAKKKNPQCERKWNPAAPYHI